MGVGVPLIGEIAGDGNGGGGGAEAFRKGVELVGTLHVGYGEGELGPRENSNGGTCIEGDEYVRETKRDLQGFWVFLFCSFFWSKGFGFFGGKRMCTSVSERGDSLGFKGF